MFCYFKKYSFQTFAAVKVPIILSSRFAHFPLPEIANLEKLTERQYDIDLYGTYRGIHNISQRQRGPGATYRDNRFTSGTAVVGHHHTHYRIVEWNNKIVQSETVRHSAGDIDHSRTSRLVYHNNNNNNNIMHVISIDSENFSVLQTVLRAQ